MFSWLLIAPMFLSERQPKPDVGNLFREQAHAPLPLRAGHARMPPGLPKMATEFSERGFHAPPSGFHGRRSSCGCSEWKLQY